MASRRGPDNSVRVAIAGTSATENWANIFHAQLTTGSAITAADLTTWLASFAALYKSTFGTFISSEVNFLEALATCYTPGSTVVSAQSAMTGTGSGSTMVDNNATTMIFSWRGGKPRTYLPGVPVSLCNDYVHLNATGLNDINVQGAAFIAGVNALTHASIATTTFGFISYSSGNVPRTPAVFFPITSAIAHSRLGTQRRRLGKWSR